MKNKDKQIRELKEVVEERTTILMLGILFICLLFFFLTIAVFQVKDYKQQLESCQDKVPVWTLNVLCVYDEREGFLEYEELTTMRFESYLSYQQRLEFINGLEYCEVIE